MKKIVELVCESFQGAHGSDAYYTIKFIFCFSFYCEFWCQYLVAKPGQGLKFASHWGKWG